MILINRAASPVISHAQDTTRSILIVDDNAALASGLQASLECEGYSVDVAGGGRDTLEHIALVAPDMIILELIRAQVSGLEIVRYLGGSGSAVLVLASRSQEADNVHIVRSGAHRTEYRFGNVIVDRTRRTISKENREVDLRPMEFDLLLNLLDADGRVVSRQALMQNVWHYAPGIATRTVDQHINRLRKNLEDVPAAPRHIITVRKAGYRIAL